MSLNWIRRMYVLNACLITSHLSSLLIITIITYLSEFVIHVVVYAPGREGGSRQSQKFSGEQHLYCWWSIHHCLVSICPGSTTQPLRPTGIAPPQPHGHHTRYHHSYHQHNQDVTGSSYIKILLTTIIDVSPDIERKCGVAISLILCCIYRVPIDNKSHLMIPNIELS